MPKEKDVQQLVQRLDRGVLETILLQKHRQGRIRVAQTRTADDFEDGFSQAGDMFRVVNYLPMKERLTVVPLVCKLWHELMRSPTYWLYLDIDGFSCLGGGWLQRRLRLAQLATGFIAILSELGLYVRAVDLAKGSVALPSACSDVALLKTILRLCPNIVSLSISGKAVTSTVLEAASQGQRLRALQIAETARGKSTPTDGFLRLLQRCPNLEELAFPARLLRCSKLNSKVLRWVRNCLREARGSHLSNALITKLEIVDDPKSCSGILYEAFRVLGDWFQELSEFSASTLIVMEVEKPIRNFARLKKLSVSTLSVLPVGEESERDMRARAVRCFQQILQSCPTLENLHFGFSLFLNRPNISQVLRNGALLSKMKVMSLHFAGVEIGGDGISDRGIAPGLQSLQLNFCRVNPTESEQIAARLCPNLRLLPRLNNDQHRFSSLPKNSSLSFK